MKRYLLIALLTLLSGVLTAREVRVEQVICNAETDIVIPVTLDEAQGLSVVHLVLNYNADVLSLLNVEQGTLADAFSFDFTVLDATPGQVEIISVSPTNIEASRGGSLALLRFAVRKGTEAMYSDIALADVVFNEETMTVDMTEGNPTQPRNGMVRAYATTATCTDRLVEGTLIVAPETTLDALSLEAGDALCVADTQKPIVISSTLKANGALRLIEPEKGWTTATYEILKAPVAGLTFDTNGLPEGSVLSETTEDGVTLYALSVAIANEIPVSTEIEISLADQNAIRTLLEDKLEGISSIEVKGDAEAVLAGIDLGIQPATSVEGEVLTATFALPKLTIIAFDSQAGVVKMRVEPQAGGAIKRTIVTGVLHVYGTNSLSTPMTEVASENIEIDQTAYQNESTHGEVSFTVKLGQYTFVKIVAGRTKTTSDDDE